MKTYELSNCSHRINTLVLNGYIKSAFGAGLYMLVILCIAIYFQDFLYLMLWVFTLPLYYVILYIYNLRINKILLSIYQYYENSNDIQNTLLALKKLDLKGKNKDLEKIYAQILQEAIKDPEVLEYVVEDKGYLIHLLQYGNPYEYEFNFDKINTKKQQAFNEYYDRTMMYSKHILQIMKSDTVEKYNLVLDMFRHMSTQNYQEAITIVDYIKQSNEEHYYEQIYILGIKAYTALGFYDKAIELLEDLLDNEYDKNHIKYYTKKYKKVIKKTKSNQRNKASDLMENKYYKQLSKQLRKLKTYTWIYWFVSITIIVYMSISTGNFLWLLLALVVMFIYMIILANFKKQVSNMVNYIYHESRNVGDVYNAFRILYILSFQTLYQSIIEKIAFRISLECQLSDQIKQFINNKISVNHRGTVLYYQAEYLKSNNSDREQAFEKYYQESITYFSNISDPDLKIFIEREIQALEVEKYYLHGNYYKAIEIASKETIGYVATYINVIQYYKAMSYKQVNMQEEANAILQDMTMYHPQLRGVRQAKMEIKKMM